MHHFRTLPIFSRDTVSPCPSHLPSAARLGGRARSCRNRSATDGDSGVRQRSERLQGVTDHPLLGPPSARRRTAQNGPKAAQHRDDRRTCGDAWKRCSVHPKAASTSIGTLPRQTTYHERSHTNTRRTEPAPVVTSGHRLRAETTNRCMAQCYGGTWRHKNQSPVTHEPTPLR